MILRRVSGHVKAQHWFTVALDLLIVILGVFIGIEVANWNEARQGHNEERRYYSQLLVDLRTDLDTLSLTTRHARSYDQAAEWVLAKLDGRPPPGIPSARLALAIHYAGFIYLPRAARGTYDELISTGNLGLLRDQEIKLHVAAYYGLFDELRQWDTLLRGQQNDYWIETAGILPRSLLRAAIRGSEPTLPMNDEREIWKSAQSRSRLPDLLVGMAAHQERVRRDSEVLTARATELIVEIERHLAEGT
jgi:hypothetical protein